MLDVLKINYPLSIFFEEKGTVGNRKLFLLYLAISDLQKAIRQAIVSILMEEDVVNEVQQTA